MKSLSQSKVKTFLRCPKKYEYRYEEGLVPKQKVLPMERGTWIHECLEAYYLGKDWKKTLKRLTREFRHLFEEEREHLGDLPGEVDRIMRGYLAHWDDSHWEVLAAEKPFHLKLKSGLIIKGKLDLVIRDNVGVWVCEHKSNQKLPRDAPRIPDPQTTLYNYALHGMGITDLVGTIHNHVRTTPPSVPYLLKRGGLSKARGIDTDYRTYRAAIKENGLDPKDYRDVLHRMKHESRFFRRFNVPWKKTAVRPQMEDYKVVMNCIETWKRFPRHISQMCERDCQFFEVCMIELHGGEASRLKRKKFTVDRRDYA